jgi:hypothetical protein
MKTFATVEDYLEIIGGWRDPDTNTTPSNQNFLWFSFNPIISLARYDVSVLDSMCTSAVEGKALTTRQGDLAVKVLLKYRRQFAQKGIDVSPVEQPAWRRPLRVMDYGKRMYIQDDAIMLEFPFSNELIDGLREFRKDSQGKGEWNKDRRRWEFALTEYNLAYLHTWAAANQFVIDDETRRLMGLILAAEQTPYAIELDYNDGELTIKNADNSLIEYVVEHCGGFHINNLERLVDLAPVLGYTVSKDIAYAWQKQYGDFNLFLSAHREVKMPHDDYSKIVDVLDYSDMTGRWPLVIFEPDTSNKMLSLLQNSRDSKDIYHVKNKRDVDTIPEGVKYIYTIFPIKSIRIPLLVSTAGMMFGGEKNYMMQNTDKAIYFAAEVFSTKKEHKVVEFESNISNQG